VDGALLKGLSWIVLFAPEWTAGKNPGVPLKNYIDQSQEFALCMVALTPFVITLYKRQGVGKTGLAAEVTKNPPNQTLNVAVQWGVTGIAVLYGMWLAHLLLFRGEGLANWIRLVVVQNLTLEVVTRQTRLGTEFSPFENEPIAAFTSAGNRPRCG
jgi:hypothetical protein